MTLHYWPPPGTEQRFLQLEYDLDELTFPMFRDRFNERFAQRDIEVAVKNGHWRQAHTGPHRGVHLMHSLAYVENGHTDHDGDFIMLLGTCKYAFSREGALYIMSEWEGFDIEERTQVRKTRQHLIVRI